MDEATLATKCLKCWRKRNVEEKSMKIRDSFLLPLVTYSFSFIHKYFHENRELLFIGSIKPGYIRFSYKYS